MYDTKERGREGLVIGTWVGITGGQPLVPWVLLTYFTMGVTFFGLKRLLGLHYGVGPALFGPPSNKVRNAGVRAQADSLDGRYLFLLCDLLDLVKQADLLKRIFRPECVVGPCIKKIR
jgi:hypothetical protein